MKRVIGLALLLSETVFAASFTKLDRSDMGVSYTIPDRVQKQDLAVIKEELGKKRKEKTYYQYVRVPTVSELDAPHPVARVQGRMNLFSAQAQGLSEPIVALDCAAVKAGSQAAKELLEKIDADIKTMEELLKGLDTAPDLERLAHEIELLSQSISANWAQVNTLYPARWSTEKYHLVYRWNYPFNQACFKQNRQSVVPSFEELSLPGLHWQASSGQLLGDFLDIVSGPSYELSQIGFTKEVSLASACLDSQRVQIRAKASSGSSADCPSKASINMILDAGTEDLTAQNVGEKRMASRSCPAVFKDLRDHLAQAHAILPFQASSLKLRTPDANGIARAHGGYMEGHLQLAGEDLFVGSSKKLFSDRRVAGAPNQKFPAEQADDVALRLKGNGGIDVTLLTWGSTLVSLQNVSCFEDSFGSYATGWMQEGNGLSEWTISLHKGMGSGDLIKFPKDLIDIGIVKPIPRPLPLLNPSFPVRKIEALGGLHGVIP